MAKSMVYVKTYPDENYVVSSGIGFRLFYDSLQNKPRNMLLLSNAFAKAKIDSDIFLEYADPSTIPLLYQDDIYNYGDFCWVDYEYDEDKKKISNQTLAELLYLNHYKKPLHTPFWKDLNNEYAYLSHDDDWWMKVYLHNTDIMKTVMHNKILSELKGRKKDIANIEGSILDDIWQYGGYGLAFDFDNKQNTSDYTGVRFYQLGTFENMDEMQRHLYWLRGKLVDEGGWLEYSARKKTWKIY